MRTVHNVHVPSLTPGFRQLEVRCRPSLHDPYGRVRGSGRGQKVVVLCTQTTILHLNLLLQPSGALKCLKLKLNPIKSIFYLQMPIFAMSQGTCNLHYV